jgi:DNA-binding protein HU-beta
LIVVEKPSADEYYSSVETVNGDDLGNSLLGNREGARMTKADLVACIAKGADLTRRQSERVLDVLVHSVQEALCQGDSVMLVGLGTFAVQSRAARKGRNPRTGQEMWIPAKKTPTFRAGKGLREAIK